jgi:pimeloyl-ACP methyl ester carboxylesterase
VSTPPFLDLPAGTRRRTIDTERGSFQGFEAGRPGDPVAILIPGFTGSKEDFVAVLPPLAAAGFHVLTYDQRGQYETPGPAAAEGWTIEAFAADALAVTSSVSASAGAGSAPVHLLGHSFGGLVARAAVIAEPKRFASLVLLGSGPAALPPEQATPLHMLADALDAFDLPTVATLKRAYDVEAGWLPAADPAIAAFVDARFLANDPGCLAAMARILATEPDRTDELADVAPRTLVAYGAGDDAWLPKLQSETASRLGATVVSFPEAAHSPAAESPGDTAQALAAFWADDEDDSSPPPAEEGH